MPGVCFLQTAGLYPSHPTWREFLGREQTSPAAGHRAWLNPKASLLRSPDLPLTPHTFCRYKDYREPPWSEHKYDISKDFWAVLAARLAFVIVFQVCVVLGTAESGETAPGKCRQEEEELIIAGGRDLEMSLGALRRTLTDLNLSSDQENVINKQGKGGLVRAGSSIEQTCRKKPVSVPTCLPLSLCQGPGKFRLEAVVLR